MTTRIYVSAHRIGQRVQGAADDFPIAVEEDRGGVYYVQGAEIHGPSRVIYRPDAPNEAGARCWVEVPDGVLVTPYSEERVSTPTEE